MPSVKILVVDDEQSILDLVTAYLRREGYEVLHRHGRAGRPQSGACL